MFFIICDSHSRSETGAPFFTGRLSRDDFRMVSLISRARSASRPLIGVYNVPLRKEYKPIKSGRDREDVRDVLLRRPFGPN